MSRIKAVAGVLMRRHAQPTPSCPGGLRPVVEAQKTRPLAPCHGESPPRAAGWRVRRSTWSGARPPSGLGALPTPGLARKMHRPLPR
jgi:hypothetical protein